MAVVSLDPMVKTEVLVVAQETLGALPVAGRQIKASPAAALLQGAAVELEPWGGTDPPVWVAQVFHLRLLVRLSGVLVAEVRDETQALPMRRQTAVAKELIPRV